MTIVKHSTKSYSEVNKVNNNDLDVYRYKVDFAEVENYMDIHGVLMRHLDFPDYYGGNRWIVDIRLIPAVFSPFYRYLRRI